MIVHFLKERKKTICCCRLCRLYTRQTVLFSAKNEEKNQPHSILFFVFRSFHWLLEWAISSLEQKRKEKSKWCQSLHKRCGIWCTQYFCQGRRWIDILMICFILSKNKLLTKKTSVYICRNSWSLACNWIFIDSLVCLTIEFGTIVDIFISDC